jgi:hypothetical protein
MRIGIIAEGGADVAVITNLLKGVTGLDSNDIVPILPKMNFDNTHLAHLNPESFSNWNLITKECIERKRIEEFFSFEDSTHIVIHIDTAESHLYEIEIPQKNYHEYCSALRNIVTQKLNALLEGKYSDKILYAIAIEETDAWILAIIDNSESCKSRNPKKKLQFLLKEKIVSNYDNFLKLSKPFSNETEIKKKKYLERNCSLRLFYEEIQEKLSNESFLINE